MVLYIKEITNKEVPISIKKGKKIILTELLDNHEYDYNLVIGVFMTPFSVHYNRFPFSGKIENMYYKKNSKNQTMLKAFLNILLNIKPLAEGCDYITENERNITILGNDDLECALVQIADNWVNQINNYNKPGDMINKGEKLGIIRMGSQCDLFLKIKSKYKILVKEGEYVKAGSTVLIELEE